MVNYLISISKDSDKRSNTRRPTTQMNSCVWQDQLIKASGLLVPPPSPPSESLTSFLSCSRSPTILPFLFGSASMDQFAELFLPSHAFPPFHFPIMCYAQSRSLVTQLSCFLFSICSDQFECSELKSQSFKTPLSDNSFLLLGHHWAFLNAVEPPGETTH